MLDPRRSPFIAGVSYGLMHALLFGIAFPPIGWWWGVLLAAVPLMLLAARTDRPARSAVGAGLASIPMWAFHHQYVWAMSEAGFFPLMAYLAVYAGLFVWMLGRVHARWPRLPIAVAAPVIWTGLEVLRGEVVWDGYAQYLVAHPLIDRWIAFAAQYAGVYAIGGLVVASASVWVPNRLPRAPSPAPLGDHPIRSIAILLACWAVFAALILPTPKILDSREGPTFRVAAIQTNVPQDNRVAQSFEERLRDFEEFCRLTRDAAKAEPRPDLIVWPEGMFPGFALNGEAVQVERGAVLHYPDGSATTVFYDRLIELQKEIGVPMLVGASAAEGLKITAGDGGRVEVTQEALFNSAFMVRGGVVEEARYDKMRLMPFGEVMPYISKWDWLEERLLALGGRGLTFDWEAGTRTVVFEIDKRNGDPARSAGPPVRVAAPICFEAMYAGQMRRLANGEGQPADVLVNMSNDGWFAWFDGGRENLVLQCRWRALELRRPILRAVNTGISVAIDSDGRVVRRLGPRRAGVLIAEFDVSPGPGTISGRMRDVVGWLCLGGMILLTAGAVWRRSKSDGKGARG